MAADPLQSILGWGSPTIRSGAGAEGGIDVSIPNLETVAGQPLSAYTTRRAADQASGPGGEVGPAWETLNPATGQWEPSYRVPYDLVGNATTYLPASVAQQIPGSTLLSDFASYKTAGHLEDNMQGLEVGAVGVGGPLLGGAVTGALGGAGAAAGATGAAAAGTPDAFLAGGSTALGGSAAAEAAGAAGVAGAAGAGGAGTGAAAAGTPDALLAGGSTDLGGSGAAGGAGTAGAAGAGAGSTGAGAAGTPDAFLAGGSTDLGGSSAGTLSADSLGGGFSGGSSFAPATDYAPYGSGTGTFGAPGADATAAQATSGGTIGSGSYDVGTSAAAGGGTGATGDIWDKILGYVKKNPLSSAGFGLNVIGQIMKAKQGNQLANQLRATGQPAQDVATSLIDQYKSGTIPASTQFDINKWRDQQIAAVRQRYHSMGDSSAMRNAIAQIESEAAAMTDKARQGLLDQGLKALGVAQGPLTNAAMAQANQDQNFASSASSALNSLLLLQAMQSKAGGAGATGG